MINFKPQKGKAFDKLPAKTRENFSSTKYMVSTKYDGNQIFVVKAEGTVRCFTSNWKEFRNSFISNMVSKIQDLDNFTLVGEFMYDCIGRLGDRSKSAILTTLRTNFSNGIDNTSLDLTKTNVQFFDIVSDSLINEDYLYRLTTLRTLFKSVDCLTSVISAVVMTGEKATKYAQNLVNKGYEGCMLVEPTSKYHIGKRVNHSIKLKYRKTADLLCIGTIAGEGKYIGMLGALVLTDSRGRKVRVGSGLSDAVRLQDAEYFIGRVIEIEYEQILDTYIQPTFISRRLDKTEEEID